MFRYLLTINSTCSETLDNTLIIYMPRHIVVKRMICQTKGVYFQPIIVYSTVIRCRLSTMLQNEQCDLIILAHLWGRYSATPVLLHIYSQRNEWQPIWDVHVIPASDVQMCLCAICALGIIRSAKGQLSCNLFVLDCALCILLLCVAFGC